MKGIICHLWKDLTAFYVCVKTIGKFEILNKKFHTKGQRRHKEDSKGKSLNIKTHKKITIHPRST